MVDLPVPRDLRSGLHEDGSVCELLSPVDGKDAVAIRVEAVLPYHAVSVEEEGSIWRRGYTEAVGLCDGTLSPASVGSWVPGVRVATVPPPYDGVPLYPVVPRHPSPLHPFSIF